MTITLARSSLLHIGVEDALLLEVVGHSVLRKEGRLQADFGADPFALGVRSVGRMVAAPSAAELRAEVGALDLVELVDLAPGSIADGSGYVDLEFQDRHETIRETANFPSGRGPCG